MNLDPRQIILETARHFYQQGLMAGTTGNLSIRDRDTGFWITARGTSKGKLTELDLIQVDLQGQIIAANGEGQSPTASSIHQVIYSLFPEATACYQVNSVESNLVSTFALRDAIVLPPLEIVRGLDINTQNPQVKIPLFENYSEQDYIAKAIVDRFTHNPPEISALLIRNYGFTVWASSPTTDQNYIEIIEYICRYLVAVHQISEW